MENQPSQTSPGRSPLIKNINNIINNIKYIKNHQWGMIFAVLIPVAVVLFMISQAGSLLNYDYWWMIKNIYSIEGFNPNITAWFFRANEHIVTIPAIIYALNILVTRGSNIGLCLAAFFLASCQMFFLVKLVPNNLKSKPKLFLLIITIIAVFNFTPAAAHNWMRGYSGTHWILANLLAVIAIYCFTKFVETRNDKYIIVSIIGAIAGILTYSTALGIFPLLIFGAFLWRSPRRITITYIIFGIISIGGYFLTYQTPEHHPSLNQLSILNTIIYIPIYLGGIFSKNLLYAGVLGAIGLIIAKIFMARLIWQQLKESTQQPLRFIDWWPWAAIIIYTLITALMAAVSRSGFGLDQALASRYATLPSLFWLSLIILIILWTDERYLIINKVSAKVIYPSLGLLTFFIVLMYQVGFINYQAIYHRATYQPLVALSLQLGITDPVLIQERVGNKPAAFLSMIDALKEHNLVPFNQDVKQNNFCAKLDSTLNINLVKKPVNNWQGHFDQVTQITPEVARANGWLENFDNQVKCIVIINQEQTIRGWGMVGFERPDLAAKLGDKYLNFGWKGYLKTEPGDQLQAYVNYHDRSGWYLLENQHMIADKNQ